jgi:hypothetical protein
MNDMRREIVNQVASGRITAEEGAARLESLESVESPAPSQPATPTVTPTSAARRVKVSSVIGSAEIVGDPSIAYAVAEGPHRARQEGDTMVIEQGPLDENDTFSFGRGDRRMFVNSIDPGRRKLKVRMNPDLALTVQVNAGSLRVEGVHGAISGEVLAGGCKISDFTSPLDLSIQAGNLSASGRLDGGASKVRCEMGNVTINLEKGSSVKVTARTTMGRVSVESGGAEPVILGLSAKQVTVGSGEGSLDVDCTMGNVRVSA